MYSNKLAIAVKSHGRVLREFQDAVYVPFGSEYSILVKNLETVRALVSVSIDGVDVGDGTEFIVRPNSEVELERFIKNGNLNQGNRFKFIERTGSIEQNRGVKIEDGIIRVEFKFEKRVPKTIIHHDVHHTTHHYWHDWPTYRPLYTAHDTYRCGSGGYDHSLADIQCSSGLAQNATETFGATAAQVGNVLRSKGAPIPAVNEAGITVPGSLSSQSFYIGEDFPTEAESYVMVLRILGETDTGKRVEQAVTVKAKPKCVTCGRVNKSNAKFCQECGTALEIV